VTDVIVAGRGPVRDLGVGGDRVVIQRDDGEVLGRLRRVVVRVARIRVSRVDEGLTELRCGERADRVGLQQLERQIVVVLTRAGVRGGRLLEEDARALLSAVAGREDRLFALGTRRREAEGAESLDVLGRAAVRGDRVARAAHDVVGVHGAVPVRDLDDLDLVLALGRLGELRDGLEDLVIGLDVRTRDGLHDDVALSVVTDRRDLVEDVLVRRRDGGDRLAQRLRRVVGCHGGDREGHAAHPDGHGRAQRDEPLASLGSLHTASSAVR
jgi:hypothetical protein